VSSLPLTYHSLPVGIAQCEPAFTELAHLTWTLALPTSRRGDFRDRPDLVLALLREDPKLLASCHPYTTLRLGRRTMNLRLSRLSLRQQCIPLILSTIFHQKDNFDELSAITASIVRVVHVDGNRCNCKLSNLREITLATCDDLEDSTLFS
jgi:hypothetical protein